MNLTRVSLPLIIDQNAAFSKIMLARYIDKTPVNLSAYTAKMQFRESTKSTVVILELNTSDGSIVLGADGSIVLFKGVTIIKALAAPMDLIYDLLLIPNGNTQAVARLIQGTAFVDPGVTQQ